jgi:hypothetical protein
LEYRIIVGQGPCRNSWKRISNRLAKAAASDSDTKIVSNRLPLSTLISEIEGKTKLKWQKEWEERTKARITKVFFSKGLWQAKAKNVYYSNPHSDGDRPQKNQGLTPPLQNTGTRKLPLRQWRSNHRTFIIPVFDTAYTKSNN